MRILHIANWYPNQWNPNETPFIKEHFDACANHVDQQLWHVQVRNEGALFRICKGDYSANEHFLILDTRIRLWRLKEILTFLLLVSVRIKLGVRSWDMVNVHIAYPLLRFPRFFRYLFGHRVIITEHWTAYHGNFYLAEGSKAKRRIQNIFSHGMPVVTVSRDLMDDIIRFSGNNNFSQYIVPNVVNPTLFHPNDKPQSNNKQVFLMVATWANHKRPLLAMAAFAEILSQFPDAKLRIVGCGPEWVKMQEFVKEKDLENNIFLLGPKSKPAIAEEMRQAEGFIHPTQYETFSVVCAEAHCCGLPVMASKVVATLGVVDTTNGILVDNTHEAWVEALCVFIRQQGSWDYEQISRNAIARFSPEQVGKELVKIYQGLVLNE